MMFQKVFSEEALREFPVLREHSLLFEQGMHPGDWGLCGVVFYAAAGLRVVFHHFACATFPLAVYLIEDYIARFSDAKSVLVNQSFCGGFVKESAEEKDEVTEPVFTDGLLYYALRNGAEV